MRNYLEKVLKIAVESLQPSFEMKKDFVEWGKLINHVEKHLIRKIEQIMVEIFYESKFDMDKVRYAKYGRETFEWKLHTLAKNLVENYHQF